MTLFEKSAESARRITLQILEALIGNTPLERLRIRLWDGTHWPERPGGDGGGESATLVLQHPGALREMLLPHSEAAMGASYLQNDFDVEGDMESAFELADRILAQTQGWSKKLQIVHLLSRLPSRPADRPEAARRRADFRDELHTPGRDQAAIAFHYDLSNGFYALWLDSRKVYSCAHFERAGEDLETAQERKLDTICRKLGLRPGMRLLDIGCGWGGLILHAAAQYGVRATGITLSERQAEYARGRICELGLSDQVEVRLQDYRAVDEPEGYDALASIGMVEHIGRKNLPRYYETAHRLLKPGGLFLNHGICTGVAAPEQHGASFIEEYVFPDADLYPLAEMNAPAEAAGFEIRDVDNWREHYALTLRHWVRRLEARHDEALAYVTEPVYRTWRVYMAGSAHRFKQGALAVYQTLLAKLGDGGRARVPLTRARWYR